MNYVLEILDGDRVGETFPLGDERISIGRKASNVVVLRDEKVSGEHAEVVQEEGRFVLRDLKSRNGTLLDGRRIEEVALNAFDTFQVGRTIVRFRDADADAPPADMFVHRVDQARLAQSGKRRGVMGLVALLLIAGGAGAWFFFQSEGGKARRAGGAKQMPKVPGNKLAPDVAHCEDDGADQWNLRASGLGFVFGGPERTGNAALEARREGSGNHALARLARPQSVLSGEALRFSGWLQTFGGARAALRLRFSSSQEDGREIVCVGSELTSYDGYTEVAVDAAVPPGMDQVDIEVLALLGSDEDAAVADDLALVRGGDGVVLDLKREARHLVGASGDFLIKSAQEPVLLGVRPLVAGTPLAPLAAAGLLTLSDAGMQASVEERDDGFAVSLDGGGAGVALVLPAESAASGVLARGADGPFAVQTGQFALDTARELLVGDGATRLLVRLSEPAAVRGAAVGDRFRFELPGTSAFELIVRYPDEAERARAALREAEARIHTGDHSAALAHLRTILEEVPHDSETTREASRLRGELLAQLGKRMEELRADLAKAEFFRIRGSYETLRSEVDDLVKSYGEENLPEPQAVRAMREKVSTALSELRAAERQSQREQLEELIGVFGETGDKELAELIRGYVEQQLKDKDKGGN